MTDLVDRGVRDDVVDVVLRYATGIDRRDWAQFRTCFTDDCDADYGDVGAWRGVDEITAFMEQVHAPCGHTLHRITNLVVTAHDDGGVGVRSYVDAVVMQADNRTGMRIAGCYDDELVRTDAGWRIARRRFTMVHAEALGPLRA